MKQIGLRSAHEEFKNFLKENKKSNSTVVAYGKDIDQLVSFLEELKKHDANETSKEDIEAFLAKLSKEGYTPKSISRKINSTRTFYRFLKVNEYVTDDPSLLVAHPKYQLAAPRILNPMEYRALRDAARNDARMFAVIELLLQTGIRIGELANLRLSDIANDSLHIAPFEKHEDRIVPLNKRAQEALGRYMDLRPKVAEDHVFVTKSGKPFLIRNIRTAVERYFRLAEIKDAKVNDLRHTFASWLVQKGASIYEVSKLLGHSSVNVTQIYSHLRTEDLRVSINLLNN